MNTVGRAAQEWVEVRMGEVLEVYADMKTAEQGGAELTRRNILKRGAHVSWW